MKNVFIFLLLSLLFALSPLRYAQKSDQHITIKRGDYKEFTFKHTGNITASDISFVVKLTKSFSSPRLIQKQNDDTTEISTTYTSPFTYIKVKLLQSDTRGFTSLKYFYDIVADSTTIFDGELRINPDVQTQFDGVEVPTSRFYVAGTFIDSSVADGSVFVWDSTNQTLSAISKDSIWQFLDVSDTVDRYVADLQSELDSIVEANSYYSLTFNYPVGGEELFIEKTDFAFTIDSIRAETRDSAITFNLRFASDWDSTPSTIFSSYQSVISNNLFTSFSDATIPDSYYLSFVIGDVEGLYNEVLTVKIYYR